MTTVVVPVRYPLSENSTATLRRAIEVAHEEDADVTVLHVNLYHDNNHATRADLKTAVESKFDDLPSIRYVVRTGMLVEETILEEVAEQRANIIVIGEKQVSRWRQMIRRIAANPDIQQFLEDEVDAKIITATTS